MFNINSRKIINLIKNHRKPLYKKPSRNENVQFISQNEPFDGIWAKPNEHCRTPTDDNDETTQKRKHENLKIQDEAIENLSEVWKEMLKFFWFFFVFLTFCYFEFFGEMLNVDISGLVSSTKVI